MKRKILFRATAVILAIASLAATIVVKISEFPAVTTPADTDLLLLASGATNKNITFANFRNAIGGTSSTAVNNIYVTNISVTNINVQNITAKGKSVAESYVNGTDVLRPNFKDGAAVTFVVSAVTNITPTLGALTGDVTTSANGLATTIANSAITDAKVSASAAIARSKLAAGTANHILINDGSGNVSSEATLGASRFPAITGDVTTPGGSLASTIAANAVTDAKFRQGVARSVVGVTGNATANTADIQGTADQVLRVNGAGTALGFGAIDLSKTAAAGGLLQAASVPAFTGDITTPGGSLATTIANGAVTYAKMQNISTTQKVLGRNTAGSGSAEEVGISALLDWLGSTRGSVLYRGASGWTILAPGTSGYVFTANGAGADPSYQAPAGGGLATSASQYVIVGGSASGTANWTALSNAYVTAKSATPNGNALSALNRYTVFLLPGVYDLGSSTLTLDTQFIDVTGISPNTGVTSYNSGLGVYDYGDTVLKSSSDVVSLTANDIAIVNLALVTSGGGSVALKSAAFASQFKAINLLVYNSSALTNPGMSTDVNFNGTWTDVRCWNSKSFGGGNPTTVAGYYTHCKAGASGFVGGAFSGGAITMSATCVDCEADAQSFGGGGNRSVTLSGTFIRCRFNNATAAGGSFFGNSGNSATFSGTFIDISSEDSDSFYGTVTGIMTGCNSTVANNPLTVNGGTVLNCSLPAATITLTSGTVRNSVFANKTYNESGTGTGTATAGGTIKVSTTTTGNVGGGEDNLITYSVPANTLTVNGDFLEFDTAGSFNNSTHNKQLKVYFGATAIFDTGSLSGATLGASSWRAHGKIIRTGAATQKATTEFTLSGALLGALTTTTTTYTTAAETLSSASTFKCTGTDLDATPANNEVVQEIEVLKWYPSN